MKDSNPRVRVQDQEELERYFGKLKADTGYPKIRIRGFAMEFAKQNDEDFRAFVEEYNEV